MALSCMKALPSNIDCSHESDLRTESNFSHDPYLRTYRPDNRSRFPRNAQEGEADRVIDPRLRRMSKPSAEEVISLILFTPSIRSYTANYCPKLWLARGTQQLRLLRLQNRVASRSKTDEMLKMCFWSPSIRCIFRWPLYITTARVSSPGLRT